MYCHTVLYCSLYLWFVDTGGLRRQRQKWRDGGPETRKEGWGGKDGRVRELSGEGLRSGGVG